MSTLPLYIREAALNAIISSQTAVEAIERKNRAEREADSAMDRAEAMKTKLAEAMNNGEMTDAIFTRGSEVWKALSDGAVIKLESQELDR